MKKCIGLFILVAGWLYFSLKTDDDSFLRRKGGLNRCSDVF